jgi:hypothetical protein
MNFSSKHNGIASRPIQKRRSPPRELNLKREINHAYVDNQILRRPQTVKQTTPAEMVDSYDIYALCFQPEFEIDAYASNEDLIRRFVSTNA